VRGGCPESERRLPGRLSSALECSGRAEWQPEDAELRAGQTHPEQKKRTCSCMLKKSRKGTFFALMAGFSADELLFNKYLGNMRAVGIRIHGKKTSISIRNTKDSEP